jgi:hypothetical protein
MYAIVQKRNYQIIPNTVLALRHVGGFPYSVSTRETKGTHPVLRLRVCSSEDLFIIQDTVFATP